MSKKQNIQAVVAIDDKGNCFYYYDKEIEDIISRYVKNNLLSQGKRVTNVKTTLYSPAKTYEELVVVHCKHTYRNCITHCICTKCGHKLIKESPDKIKEYPK